MAYTIEIQGSDLIDWLEEKVGDVYPHIDENDRITEIKLHYGDRIEITIGEEEG